ncbi:MAG: hypothetical protein JO301_15865 [Chitinophagaceae bacterium]|nr:hypothetical protein [Chitinophagaceae bacterium]
MRKAFLLPSLTVLLACCGLCAAAQGYQALHGSPFAGSTAVFNNPAASVGSAYKWDLSLFSTQFKLSTNGSYLKDFSLSNSSDASLTMRDGNFSRYLHNNFDLSFLNFLYKLDDNRAVNFNLRARMYNHLNALPFNYVDSAVSSLNSFLIVNRNTPFLEGGATHAGWLEADLNYSQLLAETDRSRLTGGFTLQLMKGLSGAFMRLSKISYLEQKNGTDTSYLFTNGRGSYGYSDNFDNADNFKDFLNQSKLTLGLSLGIEYMVYNTELADVNNNLNYDWKIGVSLMDLGAHSFKTSQYSRQFADPINSIPDGNAEQKFSGISDARAFSDSIGTLFNSSSVITDNFTISNPTRLILNVDKNLGNHFYVNGELSVNFYSASSPSKLRTKELNLLTVTPRWETMGLGAYLPVQYNTQGQLWVGAAIKLGPLVVGLHNLGLFKKDPGLNGGGYLMFSLHPFGEKKVASKLDCR